MRSLHFAVEYKIEEISLIIKNLKSNNDLFNYLIDSFENNKVIFKEIKDNKMFLFLNYIDQNKEEQKLDIDLKYEKENIHYIIDYLWDKFIKMKKSLNKINEQNNQIKDEYEKLREKNKILKDENNKIKEDNQKLNQEITQIKKELNKLMEENKQFKEETQNIIENYDKLKEKEIISKKNFSQNNTIFDNNLNNKNNNVNSSLINPNNNKNKFYFNKSDKKSFSLLFKESGGYIITTLNTCFSTDKVSDIMNKYRKQSNNNENFYFIYNAKQLDPNITLADAGIKKMETINVIKTKGFFP